MYLNKSLATNVANLLTGFVLFQAAKEKRFLKLCYDGAGDIRDFSSLLMQGVDPNVYDKVNATV